VTPEAIPVVGGKAGLWLFILLLAAVGAWMIYKR
jgi:hypothetical protein